MSLFFMIPIKINKIIIVIIIRPSAYVDSIVEGGGGLEGAI